MKKKVFRSVQDRWNEFQRMVLPPDSSPTQFQEMRKAFLAGYFDALVALNEATESGLAEDVLVRALNDHVKATQETLQETIIADMRAHQQREKHDGRPN